MRSRPTRLRENERVRDDAWKAPWPRLHGCIRQTYMTPASGARRISGRPLAAEPHVAHAGIDHQRGPLGQRRRSVDLFADAECERIERRVELSTLWRTQRELDRLDASIIRHRAYG